MRNTQHESNDRKSQSQQAGRMGNEARDKHGDRDDDRARDAQGRFIDDDDTPGSRRASQRNADDEQPRDAQGRFKDEDDGQSGSGRRTASERDDNDDPPRDAQGRFSDDDKGSRSRN